jgi:predicted dehydrogenase
MRFLIAGYGSIGRRHMRNLLSLGERDIVFYRTCHSTLPAEEIADFPVETDLDAALNHKPDAVIVSNPTALHLEVAIPAAEAGCHLLLEKPVSHTLDRIDRLQSALAHGGGQVLVGFQFRYHPTMRAAARLLQENVIGAPFSVRAHWGEYLPAWHPWEDYHLSYAARADLGGGVIHSLCHPFDYLSWLMGGIDSLWAFSGSLGGLGLSVEDTSEIGLRFKSGAMGSLHLDCVQRPPAHHWQINGQDGTMTWDNATAELRVFRASANSWEVIPPPEGFERNDLFLAEMRHFLDVIRGEVQPTCSLQDGIQALEIALQARASAADGRMKIL